MALNDNALTTLANVKSHLGMDQSYQTEDARLELFINAASSRIERFCDRKFQMQTHTEYFHGRRQNILMPRQWPLVSVTELKIACDRDWDNTDPEDEENYSIDDDANTVGYDYIFPTGRQNIRLIYTAGYSNVSGQASDLELACIWFVEWFYRHRDREDMGMSTMTKNDESVGVLSIAPPMIMELINPYKRVEMPDTYSPVRNM